MDIEDETIANERDEITRTISIHRYIYMRTKVKTIRVTL